MTRHKRRKPGLRSLYQWHRYLGLVAALLLPALTLSGIMLNHTDALGLGKREIRKQWLLDWYGIAPVEGRFFSVGEQWLSQWGDQLYLDSAGLPYRVGPLAGAVRLPSMIVAATSDELLLLSPEGELLERMDALDGIPGDIDAVAQGTKNGIVLRTPAGAIEGDPGTGSWQRLSVEPAWPEATLPPDHLLQQLVERNPGPGLSAERLTLDLHSGRLFGDLGVYAVDLAAGLLLFNAISGVLIWWRRRRQQRLAATRSGRRP